MSVVDRFICRREGHKPSLTLDEAQGITAGPYITSCVRCGKVYEVQPEQAAADGEDAGRKR